MSNQTEAVNQALRAVDASLSVLVVARDALIRAQADLQKHPQEPTPGAVPAGQTSGPCQHPTAALIDTGLATGQMICAACGEEAPPCP
jgi:hypothetical protein